MLSQKVLTVVNPDTRLACVKGIEKPYCEGLGHASGDLSTVQPGYFGSLCCWLRSTRQRAAAEDQGDDTKAHVLIDASQLAGLDGDAGLFEDFAAYGVARVLVKFDDPARQDPFSVIGPFDGEHPAVFTDDRASNADRMTREVVRMVLVAAASHLEARASRISLR